jgi:hypothetical protein
MNDDLDDTPITWYLMGRVVSSRRRMAMNKVPWDLLDSSIRASVSKGFVGGYHPTTWHETVGYLDAQGSGDEGVSMNRLVSIVVLAKEGKGRADVVNLKLMTAAALRALIARIWDDSD